MSGYNDHPMDINQIMWMAVNSNPGKALWWNTFALVIQAWIVSSIITKTFQYFEYFKQSDTKLFLLLIGTGCALNVGSLGITFAEMYRLVYHAEREFHTVFRFVLFGDNAIMLLGGIFNLTCGMYYASRVWRMTNRRLWVIPLLAIGLCAPFGACLAVVAKGYKLPILVPENLPKLQPFFMDFARINKIWGGMSLAMDGILCITLTILLMRSKESVFANETRLLHKLVSLMYESMLPPVIFLIIAQASGNMQGAPNSLYFHSVLSALVSRQTIRGMLEARLSSEGVKATSKGSGGVYASFSYPSSSRDGAGTLTVDRSKISGEGEYEMSSKEGSVEQNVKISRLESHRSGHPFLSSVNSKSEAHRN
uniref:Integral membrane protein n=1 Tax=Kwoniella bestiolae CBS 10118 TaxID=1296100 RepID=A0A1B9G8H6_9TREE|nr:hypothetical protein I302_02131 [Kwoniella bestiolae CBS 10118]OCF27290.1 hypothetical protein I302_02131 [Kwoniella bestiolae CBS 10118]